MSLARGLAFLASVRERVEAARGCGAEGEVVFREGWQRGGGKCGGLVKVVSGNWSRAGVLERRMLGSRREGEGGWRSWRMRSRGWMGWRGSGGGDGEVVWRGGGGGGFGRWGIRGGLLGRCWGGREGGVFVGDGVTDLEALLAVDVGVFLRGEGRGRGQRELRECLERVGVECGWSGEYGVEES